MLLGKISFNTKSEENHSPQTQTLLRKGEHLFYTVLAKPAKQKELQTICWEARRRQVPSFGTMPENFGNLNGNQSVAV